MNSNNEPLTPIPGSINQVITAGKSVLVSSFRASDGYIVNPGPQIMGVGYGEDDYGVGSYDATTIEFNILYVDPTGPAATKVTATTVAIQPGGRYRLPPSVSPGVWVNSKTSGHTFTVIQIVPESLLPPTQAELDAKFKKGNFPPSGPTGVLAPIPSYLYQQYSMDDDLQGFVAAYNSMMQDIVDTFNALNLPIYTQAPISGALLDWVGNGLYGYPRPALTYSSGFVFGPYNTFVFNRPNWAYNKQYVALPSPTILANDDIYRRCITWHFYKNDGKYFGIDWLKKRVMRWLTGTNGAALNIDQTYQVSITFNPYGQLTIRIINGIRTVVSGAIYNSKKGMVFNSANSVYNGLGTIYQAYTPLPYEQQFKAAILSRVLELPFQYTYDIVLDLPLQPNTPSGTLPIITVPPFVSGVAVVNYIFSCTPGTWLNTPTSFEYQWLRNGLGIPNATYSTYIVASIDLDREISCLVVAINDVGNASAISNSVYIPIPIPSNTVAPVISGITVVGSTLSCTTGTWESIVNFYHYQWLRDGVNIPGATSSTYVLQDADWEKTISCKVTAGNDSGSASALSSNALYIITMPSVWRQSDADQQPVPPIISPDGLTFTVQYTSGWQSIRSMPTSHATGKWYVEYLVGAEGEDVLGMASESFDPTNSLGATNYSTGAGSVGAGGSDGFQPIYGPPIGSPPGTVWGWAIDFDIGYIWISFNGVWIGSGISPNLGTGPYIVFWAPALGQAYFPTVSEVYASANYTLQSRPDTQTYLPPMGYQAWDGGPTTPTGPLTIYLTDTTLTSWVVPSNWNNADNSVECIGGGGGGSGGGADVGNGGEGGHYAKSTNLTLTPSSTLNIAIGAGGPGQPDETTGIPGGATWFGGTSLATSLCGAVGGLGALLTGADATTPTTDDVGDVVYQGGYGRGFGGGDSSGGNAAGGAAGPGGAGGGGGSEASGSGGGGGGAGNTGGPGQVGFDGIDNFTGGNGGAAGDGTLGGLAVGGGDGQPGLNGSGGGGGSFSSRSGGDGGAGVDSSWDATHGPGGGGGGASFAGSPGGFGGLYGGGGGGGGYGADAGGDGAQGIMVIKYVPVYTPPPYVPLNTVAPVISGSATVGNTLSCTIGTWSNSPASYSYQWVRNESNISGETNSTYVTVTDDVGTSIRCLVTANNAHGNSSAFSNSILIVPHAVSNWNTTDATTNGMTLSNGGLTLNVAASLLLNTWQIVRNTISQTSGKLYLEIATSTGATVTFHVGFASSGVDINSYLGDSNYSVGANIVAGSCFESSGFSLVGVAPSDIFGANDVIMIAIDFSANHIWIGKNNIWYDSGNPGADSNQLFDFVPATVGPLFIAMAFSTAGSDSSWTLQTTAASQTYTPPSGFSPWDS
jgi:hypothetical protein